MSEYQDYFVLTIEKIRRQESVSINVSFNVMEAPHLIYMVTNLKIAIIFQTKLKI